MTDFTEKNVSLLILVFNIFSPLSSERYTEQVTPLLVYAQRQLLLRISKFKDPDITQQPCVRYEAEHEQKVSLALLFM